ncbi:MAG: phage portal protein [Atopobiaceae bacterium]|nr:phage portal protein [Atopobiaceae bacterium]MBR1827931.1 phage portal protein [Atopobiaceae bacterium]
MTDGPGAWTVAEQISGGISGIKDAAGMGAGVREWADRLADEYDAHVAHNALVRRYFEGNVRVKDYGAGADTPCDQTCYWPAKAVDALAERVRLRGFSFDDGEADPDLEAVMRRCGLVNAYNRYVPAKYVNGCMAATVTTDGTGARVRFHSADTFTAIPDPDFGHGVVAAGLAIARRERTAWSREREVPTIVNLHLPGNVVECRQVGPGEWVAEDGPSREPEPTLYVFAHKPMGSSAPFGRTRINRFVRDITDDAIRCLWHMQISGAYYSVPKLLFLNLTSRQYDAMLEGKDKFQLDKVLLAEQNPDGSTAQISQLSGNSPQPFIDELMALAKQFSGITSVPLNSLGIVQDNPSSAEAIQAAREDICLVAEQDIADDREIIEHVARVAMAVEGNSTVAELAGSQLSCHANYREPMLHSRSEMADWAVKVASMREGFGSTDFAATAVGIPDADLASVKSDERRQKAASIASGIFGGANANDPGQLG